MGDYQVVARRYRPQTFAEVLGQDAVVSTIKNAIQHERTAHAYLFSGSQGTGKTTLARLFAKLVNCEAPTADFEPCNQCTSCREVTSGSSLDVIEIDGASNRGIEDIRQINETVGYAASQGRYKVYIIDEVHMLTGAAFNALLKTLEEPPAKVKFFFATTEPHKVLPTIISRCQRFTLARISEEKITEKLQRVVTDMGVEVASEALATIARVADGGMRDAESILDQIISFSEGKVGLDLVNEVLGLMPSESFFAFDLSAKQGDFNAAFALAEQVYTEGKEIGHYLEELTQHFRNLLLVHLSGKVEDKQVETSAKLYSREQLLTILDMLVDTQEKLRFAPSQRLALEMLLMKIVRSHQRLPIETVVHRLAELEQKLGAAASTSSSELAPVQVQAPVETQTQTQVQVPVKAPVQTPEQAPVQAQALAPTPVQAPKPQQQQQQQQQQTAPTEPAPFPATAKKEIASAPAPASAVAQAPVEMQKQTQVPAPTPRQQAAPAEPAPFPEAPKKEIAPPSPTPISAPKPKSPAAAPAAPTMSREETIKKQGHYDTILQFTAVELDGTLQKTQVRS